MVTSKSLASKNEKDSEAKKKHTPAKHNAPSPSRNNKASNGQEHGESLVGSRIRVWWPIDRKFYDGVVDSYNSSQKKHKVLYDDGDEEKLDMKKERWELIEDDASENEKESANESSDSISKLLKRKKAQANGKSSEKGRTDDAMPTKKQKTDSSAKRFKDPICVYSKSKAKSGKKSEDSEGESVKPKGGVNKAEKSRDGAAMKPDVSKDDAKQSSKNGSKPENDKMGDIGGKIVAAASRLSEMFHSKENGQKKEPETKKTAKSLNSNKKISVSNNTKQKRSSSSSEAVSSKVKGSKSVSKEMKSNSNGDTDENDDSDEKDDSSDDESKPLVSFLKKSPEAIDALKEKLKQKKEVEAVEECEA